MITNNLNSMAWLTTGTLKTRSDKNDTPWSRQFILINPNEEEIVKSQQNWLILAHILLLNSLLTFSEGIEMEHWGYIRLIIILIITKNNYTCKEKFTKTNPDIPGLITLDSLIWTWMIWSTDLFTLSGLIKRVPGFMVKLTTSLLWLHILEWENLFHKSKL